MGEGAAVSECGYSDAINADYFTVTVRLKELKGEGLVLTSERRCHVARIARLKDVLHRIEVSRR